MRERRNRRLSRRLWITVSLLTLGLVLPTAAEASGRDRGKMRVEFLYSIESTGGRGEKLRSPRDIFYDRRANELYIADAGGRGILVYDRNGAFLQELPFDDGIGSATMVATDGAGRIYIGHNRSSLVTLLSFRGDRLGTLELPGIVDVPGNQVRPMHFALGPSGAVFVLNSKGTLIKVDPEGGKHERIRIVGEDAPNLIFGMTIDPKGRFIFSDMRPYSLVVFDPVAESFRRFGSGGVAYGQIARPQGVATDQEGRIYVSSLVRNKVLCYDASGEFIEEFGGIGRGRGQFYMPSKVVSDGKDRLYVLEPPLKRVQVFRITFPD